MLVIEVWGFRRLDVVGREVVDALGWCEPAERCVAAVMVVEVEPLVESSASFGF